MARPRGFAPWSPAPETEDLVARINGILTMYSSYGPMTLRQVFYRLVAAHGYAKTERDYANLGEHVNRARRARMIDFAAIRDDGDSVEKPQGWQSGDSLFSTLKWHVDNFRLVRDIGQPIRRIVMVEAAGMVPQAARVATQFGATVMSAGGFNSTTGKYNLAEDIVAHARAEGRMTRIIHLGDYDPSGEHVFKNLNADVGAFVDELGEIDDVDFIRVALTEAQISRYSVIPAPRKVNKQGGWADNRSFAGINGDGVSTAQLEALTPQQFAAELETALRADWDVNAEAALPSIEADELSELKRNLATL